MTTKLATTCSGGGPVIAVPAEVAAEWRGTNPPRGVVVPEGWTWGAGDIECDYDRACETRALNEFEPTGYGGVGWLTVAEQPALILDAEIPTSWLPDAQGGYILRGNEVDQEDTARDLVDALGDDTEWRVLDLEWPLAGTIYLFDSAFAGAADAAEIKAFDGVAVATVAPGTYEVAVATTADETDVIRLRRR